MANTQDILYGVPPSASNIVDWDTVATMTPVVELSGSIDRMMTLTRPVSGDNITIGDGIILNSDGTVSFAGIGADTISPAITGMAAHVGFGNTGVSNYCYDSTTDKFIIGYLDSSYNLYTMTATVSGDNILFGVPNLTYTSVSHIKGMSFAYDPINEKFALSICHSRAPSYDQFLVGVGDVIPHGSDPTQDSLAYGSFTNIYGSAQYAYSTSTVYDPDTGLILIFEGTSAGTQGLFYWLGEISGSTITVSPQYTLVSSQITYLDAIYDTVNNKVVVAYSGNSNTFSYVGTVSTTGNIATASISWGSVDDTGVSSTHGQGMGYDTTNNKYVVMGFNATTDIESIVVGYPSGDNMVWGTPQPFYSDTEGYKGKYRIVYDPVNDKMVIFCLRSSDFYPQTFSAQIDHDLNTISWLDPTVIASASAGLNQLAWHPTEQRFILWRNDIDDALNPSSSETYYYLYNLNSSNVTQAGFLGIAQNSATAGNDCTVGRYGFLDETQTGLTPNTQYYLEDGGLLVTYDTGTYVGYAVTSTQLIIKA